MPNFVPVLVLALLVGGCAAGVSTSGRVVLKDDGAVVDVRFTDRDRVYIEDYYKPRKGRKGLPPGLAKRGGNLPPGLAKRDRLPPGLSGEGLPRELEVKLTPLPVNYMRIRIGRDLVLMDGRTRVIFDVIYGIGN